MEKVGIQVGSDTLACTLFTPDEVPPNGAPGVLLVHGWKGSEMGYFPIAEALTAKGAICLTVNLRGHGHSTGSKETCTRRDHLADVLAAYDWLASQPGVDPKRIGAHGASYACYLLALLSGQRQLRWLAFRIPALYEDARFRTPMIKQIDRRLKKFRHRRVMPKENRALRAMAKFTGDLLIISAGRDEDVPRATINNWLRAAKRAARVTHRHYVRAGHQMAPRLYGFVANAVMRWCGDRVDRLRRAKN